MRRETLGNKAAGPTPFLLSAVLRVPLLQGLKELHEPLSLRCQVVFHAWRDFVVTYPLYNVGDLQLPQTVSEGPRVDFRERAQLAESHRIPSRKGVEDLQRVPLSKEFDDRLKGTVAILGFVSHS